MLEFAAEHRLVLAGHVATVLSLSPETAGWRLRALRDRGLLRDGRQYKQAPACDQITRAGLTAIGSQLPAPRRSDPAGYRHDVGLAWISLAARQDAFGPLREIVSERHMRSNDGRAERREDRFGVRLGGVGPGGRDRMHYPDMVLVTESGHRVAVELELTRKARASRERILAGYASDARIDAVLYLVENRSLGQAISRSAARVDMSDRVHVQRVSFDPDQRPGEASVTRRLTRTPTRALPAGSRGAPEQERSP